MFGKFKVLTVSVFVATLSGCASTSDTAPEPIIQRADGLVVEVIRNDCEINRIQVNNDNLKELNGATVEILALDVDQHTEAEFHCLIDFMAPQTKSEFRCFQTSIDRGKHFVEGCDHWDDISVKIESY